MISTYCSHLINSSPREIYLVLFKAIIELELFGGLIDISQKKKKSNSLKVLNGVCLLKKEERKEINSNCTEVEKENHFTRELAKFKRSEISQNVLCTYTSFTTDTEVFTEEQKVNIQSEYCY